ncbi:MAG: Crp/Fnr family transcriptional regulator [Deltaproteobacteria bacterium]|nr:Crp/Fnr family transcriptional regulator [Deltaproteobacteria bacterium]
MAIDVKIIQTFKLFEELNDKELEQLASIMDIITVKEGEAIVNKGETAHTLYFILKGSFMIHFSSGKAFTLNTKEDIIGWSTLVTPFNYTGNVTALTAGKLIAAQGKNLSMLIQSNSELSGKIMKKINSVLSERMNYVKKFSKIK